MSENDPEFVRRQQEFEPEWVKDNPLFPGTEPEQAQTQRTVTQENKHKNFYNQELRQEGTSHTSSFTKGKPHELTLLSTAGLQSNRSRSQSRRARRKRIQEQQRDGKYMHTNSLEALEEADANGELQEMQPFERIGPDSTSMDGPVTKARADRGEIPMRGSNPNQPYYKKPPPKEKSKLEETDGLKLSLDVNLDIEIELKASIRGDLTLSLLYVILSPRLFFFPTNSPPPSLFTLFSSFYSVPFLHAYPSFVATHSKPR